MQFSAEVVRGQIVAILDGNVHPIVGPRENSPPGENGAPRATEIRQGNVKYLIEVGGHTDTTARIILDMIKDGLLIDFSKKDLAPGEEVNLDKLTVLHSI